MPIANTPPPPYYAVIFTSLRTATQEGYGHTSEKMLSEVHKYPGFLGYESFRDEQGFGVTISYWTDLDAIKAWKFNPDHLDAQKSGRSKWYAHYKVRISKVERDFEFLAEEGQ